MTSSPSPAPLDSFYIRLGAPDSIAKRASQYLAFVDGYGVVADSQDAAGHFALNAEGLLQTAGNFVGAKVDVAGRVLQSSASATFISKIWTLTEDGTLILAGTSGFCELQSGQIAITIAGSSAQDCVPISLVHQGTSNILNRNSLVSLLFG